MKEFEEIAHSGGKVTIKNGQIEYVHCAPHIIIMYDILVSLNGVILGRGTFGRERDPFPSLQIMMVSDKEGYFGNLCPRCKKYFRAKNIPTVMKCPYCLYINNDFDFLTSNQIKYIKLFYDKYQEHYQAKKEVVIDFDNIISSLENNTVQLNAYEERMQSLFECKKCNIFLDILGEYASCPECLERNNLEKFISKIKLIKAQTKNSDKDLNKALSNAIECFAGYGNDIKSILEYNIALAKNNQNKVKKIDFQKIIETNDLLYQLYGLHLFPENSEEKSFLNLMFQRRHLIAHNSGIVDQTYLNKTGDTTVRLGQKIEINSSQLNKFLNLIISITKSFNDEFNSLIKDFFVKIKKYSSLEVL